VGQGEAGKARGPVNRCFVCGAENPRWLKSVDQGPQDYIWRKFHDTHGNQPQIEHHHAPRHDT
jgi:hypothetical protein